MRQPRLLRKDSVSTYHCVSRIVDRNFVLRDDEKRYFYDWMRRLEKFTGLEILTYCLMSNHFHILVRVPPKDRQPPLTEICLRSLLPLLYHGRQLKEMLQELDNASTSAVAGKPQWLTEMLARYDSRRYDLSSFIKDLKQRFTQWHNGRTNRTGTLWESAFTSVLVENGEAALLAMGAYIDLNPVRAGLCNDPAEYRWSGYGEAMCGQGTKRQNARRGLCGLLEFTSVSNRRDINWGKAAPHYRTLLYIHGVERDADAKSGTKHRPGITRAALEATLQSSGQLSLAELLRCKVRYFTDGAVLGSEGFVAEIFEDHRERFGTNRKTGPRSMRGAAWGNLRTLRDLRERVFG